MKKWVFRVPVAALCATFVGAISAAELPLEAFAALPQVQGLQLSPNGQKMALMFNKDGATTILTQSWAGGSPSVLMSTDNQDFNFGWFGWKTETRLLIGTEYSTQYRCDGGVGGTRTTETRLLVAKTDTGEVVNLLKPNSFRGERQPQFQDNIIDFLREQPGEVLLSLDERGLCTWMGDADEDLGPTVVTLNVETGKRSHVLSPQNRIRGWLVDRQHRVRLGIWRKGADIEIRVRDADGQQWRTLWAYKALSEDSITPLGFGKNPNELYILANHQGRKALFTVDIGDPRLPRTLKIASDDHDISGRLVLSRKTGEIVGLQGNSRTDRAVDYYWDKDRSDLVTQVEAALPKRHNRFISFSDDETRYVVYSSSDTVPGEYYLGDDRAGSLRLFAQSYPGLPTAAMVPKAKKTIAVRDGMKLTGYLSLPNGAEAKKLPTVLLVHGGPQSHDDAGFDPWTQFLANRGYAVLQVNFRGSTGGGAKLMEAGLGRWGMEMQDDLSDAAQWAINQGVADPSRICIVGASYGGYAALMGLVKTPDLFRCGVSFAGVSDLREMLSHDDRYVDGKEIAAVQVGDRDKDRDRLVATSPRYLAAKVKVPVLLLHGDRDSVVHIEQSQFMDRALTEAGKPHRFVTLPKGGHDLGIYANGLLFYAELDKFLKENLGSGVNH